MTRQLWALMTWSSHYGAPVTVIGILGLDTGPDGTSAHEIAWMPLEYSRAASWRERLAATPPAELPAAVAVWELSLTEPAIPLDVPPSTGDLTTAVTAQLDDVLAAGLGE